MKLPLIYDARKTVLGLVSSCSNAGQVYREVTCEEKTAIMKSVVFNQISAGPWISQ